MGFNKREYNKKRYQRYKEKSLEYCKEYYQNNKKKISEQHKEWYQNKKEKILEQRKEYRQRNKDKLREQVLFKIYGITSEKVAQMIKSQNNKCLICGDDFDNVKYCIDHDHLTGEVRGILCKRCNIGLGQFRDDPILLINATNYLKIKKYHMKVELN